MQTHRRASSLRAARTLVVLGVLAVGLAGLARGASGDVVVLTE